MKANKDQYAYPLKLDKKLKEPLKKLAKATRRTINNEINIAVEKHIFDLVDQTNIKK